MKKKITRCSRNEKKKISFPGAADAKPKSKHPAMSVKLMQALEMIGAMRHLGTDQEGRKVGVIEVRAVTYFLYDAQLQELDLSDSQPKIAIGIINDVLAHLYAANNNVTLQKNGIFVAALPPPVVTHALTFLEECALLQENLDWLVSITGGDLGFTTWVENSKQSVLEKLLGLHAAMTAKFEQIKQVRSKEAAAALFVEEAPYAKQLTAGADQSKKRKTRSVRFA
jgi:hypothetical protein